MFFVNPVLRYNSEREQPSLRITQQDGVIVLIPIGTTWRRLGLEVDFLELGQVFLVFAEHLDDHFPDFRQGQFGGR